MIADFSGRGATDSGGCGLVVSSSSLWLPAGSERREKICPEGLTERPADRRGSHVPMSRLTADVSRRHSGDERWLVNGPHPKRLISAKRRTQNRPLAQKSLVRRCLRCQGTGRASHFLQNHSGGITELGLIVQRPWERNGG